MLGLGHLRNGRGCRQIESEHHGCHGYVSVDRPRGYEAFSWESARSPWQAAANSMSASLTGPTSARTTSRTARRPVRPTSAACNASTLPATSPAGQALRPAEQRTFQHHGQGGSGRFSLGGGGGGGVGNCACFHADSSARAAPSYLVRE